MATKKDERKIATYDFETDPFLNGRIPKPFCAVYYDETTTAKFWGPDCAKKLYDYIKAKDRIIFAHNGGKFDVHFLIPFIVEDNKGADLPIEPKLIGSRVSSIKCGKAELRDSVNLLPVPLKAIQKDEIEIWKLEESEREKYKDEILKYCEGDCRYLFEAVTKFFDMYGKNLTLAGTAFKYFCKEHIGEINDKGKRVVGKIPTLTIKTDEKFREWYFGGRTQAIETGEFKGNFTFIDINSAYPWAMDQNHPWGSRPLMKLDMSAEGLKRSFLKLKAVSYGCLPFRDAKGGLSFPCDKEIRTFHATGWEVLAGIETGTIKIIEVLEQRIFLNTMNFKSYMKEFFDMKATAKEKGDSFRYLISKLMMNSLYGKFGENPLKFDDFILGSTEDIERFSNDGYLPAEIVGNFRTFKKKSYIQDDAGIWNKPPRFKNVTVAASITGCVRAYMWRALLAVKRPIYCDTDSILCEDIGDLKIGTELGQWDIEGKNIYEAHIAGKKLYTVKGDFGKKNIKSGCKGARLTSQEIERVSNGEEVLYKFDAPSFSMKKSPVFVERRINAIECDKKLAVFLKDRKEGKIKAEIKVEEKRVPIKIRF